MKTLQESMALVYQLHRSSAVSTLAEDVKEAIQRLNQKDRELAALRATLKDRDAVLVMLYAELGCEATEALSRIRELKSTQSRRW